MADQNEEIEQVITKSIESAVAPLVGRVEKLETRMTTFEAAHAEDRVTLDQIHRMTESFTHFLMRFFQVVGGIALAILTAVLIGYALHWLHLK